MRKLLLVAMAAAVVVMPSSSQAVVSERTSVAYWQKKGCDHHHRSIVARNRIRRLLFNHSPYVNRERVQHYVKCVATKKKARAGARVVRKGRTWRLGYPQVYAIRVNRFSAWVINYLAALRPCEQGAAGYATDTGNTFYGAYQFTWGTWASVGGSGNPAHAAPAEQDYRAGVLLTTSGSHHWPNCP